MKQACLGWNEINDAALSNGFSTHFELVIGRPTQKPFPTAGVFMRRIRRTNIPGSWNPGRLL